MTGIVASTSTFRITRANSSAAIELVGSPCVLRIDSVATLSTDLIQTPSASITPANNGNLVVEKTSNTTLTFKLKGSDGVVRTGTITLS